MLKLSERKETSFTPLNRDLCHGFSASRLSSALCLSCVEHIPNSIFL